MEIHTLAQAVLARSDYRSVPCTPEFFDTGVSLNMAARDAMCQNSSNFSQLQQPPYQSAIERPTQQCQLVERNGILAI
jgi:hypothetical protein